MNAMRAWCASVIALVALTLALHHLGVDLSASVDSLVRSTEQVLGRPIV